MLLSLPIELHLEILECLYLNELLPLQRTSRYFHSILTPFIPRRILNRDIPDALEKALSHYFEHNLPKPLEALLEHFTPAHTESLTIFGLTLDNFILPVPALTVACSFGHPEIVELVLRYLPWPEGEHCPLRYAARAGHIEIMKILIQHLEATHGVLAPDWSGFEAAVRTAAKHSGPGELDGSINRSLEFFLEKGLTEELVAVGMEAAAKKGSAYGIRVLAKAGGEGKDQWTAAAARRGRWDLVRALIEDAGCMVDSIGVRVAGTPLLEVAQLVEGGVSEWPGWEEFSLDGGTDFGFGTEDEELAIANAEEAERWLEEGRELMKVLLRMGADVQLAECLLANFQCGPWVDVSGVRTLMREVAKEVQQEAKASAE